MRTAIVSDLHLGNAVGEDILRDPSVRGALLDELAGADRLVLLGDVVEMRELPLPAALAAAAPFFGELGKAMAGREIVLVPGNHDHRLAEPLLENAGRMIGLEQRGGPGEGAGAGIAALLGDAGLTFAYPGVWLRDDVYATHGHYMDCHMSLPRLECVAAAVMMRAFGAVPDRATPADYERVLRPIYGFSFGLAQSELALRATRPSESAWRRIAGRNRDESRLRRATTRAAIGGGIPAAIWTLNHALRADFSPELSSRAISRSGIAAATELARRLDVGGVHVITGHTHRGGPEAGEPEWPLAAGGRLHNTGSWTFASAFHHPGTPPGPYWPGTVTWLEDEGPPRRVRLLEDRSREELIEVVAGLSRATRR